MAKTFSQDDWRDLASARVDAICLGGPEVPADGHSTGLVFPGAFHPLHDGHRRMADVARRRLGRAVEFELSIQNVDKPPLGYEEVARRAAQFADQQALWLTRAPTFVEKSKLFPGATFITGADTIVRIADVRYYQNRPEQCRDAIDQIAERGCRFLVFGRLIEGQFRTLDDLVLPPRLRKICDGVSARQFRWDLSSTAIRAGGVA